jgi:hypothetical protein
MAWHRAYDPGWLGSFRAMSATRSKPSRTDGRSLSIIREDRGLLVAEPQMVRGWATRLTFRLFQYSCSNTVKFLLR